MKIILLTKGYSTVVDDFSYELVKQFNWHANKVGRRVYARRTFRRPDGTKQHVYLHQFLLPTVNDVDHKDGDGLNNQSENLRDATRQENMQARLRKAQGTSSRFRGVCWHRLRRKWVANIMLNGKGRYLGLFIAEIDAARAYDRAAAELFGSRACPNFP